LTKIIVVQLVINFEIFMESEISFFFNKFYFAKATIQQASLFFCGLLFRCVSIYCKGRYQVLRHYALQSFINIHALKYSWNIHHDILPFVLKQLSGIFVHCTPLILKLLYSYHALLKQS
jgi:hypothetical protein